jgi:chromosomal replication initiator protein
MNSAEIHVIELPLLPAPAMRTDAARVFEVVTESYACTVSELCTKDRHKCIAEARIVTYWLLRQATRFSFPEIGRVVGNRDHTTVMHGVKACDRRRDSDPGFRADTDAMLAVAESRVGGAS